MGSHAADDSAWRDDAACIGADPRIFTDPRPATGDARRAVDICQTCPVRQPCLDTALRIEAPADVGIWGGTTPHARRRLRRERHRAAGGTGSSPLARPRPPNTPSTTTDDELRLVEDGNGDFIDRSQRVIVFEIQGDPPFMLMIDGRPRARTTTLNDAAGLAARFLAGPASPDNAPVGHRSADDSLRRCY